MINESGQSFGFPVTLEDGTEIAANTELPIGAVLSNASVERAHREGVRTRPGHNEARENLAKKSVTAGVEAGITQQVSKQSDIAALSQAAAYGTADVSERLDAGTQQKLDTLGKAKS